MTNEIAIAFIDLET